MKTQNKKKLLQFFGKILSVISFLLLVSSDTQNNGICNENHFSHCCLQMESKVLVFTISNWFIRNAIYFIKIPWMVNEIGKFVLLLHYFSAMPKYRLPSSVKFTTNALHMK